MARTQEKSEIDLKYYNRLGNHRAMADKHRDTFIGGIIIGAAIGTVAGLLVAPRRGRDTRKLLQKTATAVPQMAEDVSTSVKFQADRLSATASDRWHDTLDRLAEAIAAGIVASQSVRQNDTKLPGDLRASNEFDDE
jgi:gas vesicle protein